MVNHDTGRARLGGKLERLGFPGALVLHADICQLAEVARTFAVLVLNRADEHAEAGLEGGYFASLSGVEERVGHVVDHLHGEG